VPPISFSEVRTVIENEFEDTLVNIYKEFEEKPVAAASYPRCIEQAHSGKLVAVKVQRPGIEKNINLGPCYF
jgi:ubiquinone biosynthesis protein